MKTKVLISCAATVQLICAFFFSHIYAKICFLMTRLVPFSYNLPLSIHKFVIRFHATVDSLTMIFSSQEIDECSSNPCQNNGTCTDLVNDFNCTCVHGYEGRTCGNNIDDCAGINCDGAFTKCYDLLNDFRCGCLPGYQSK